MQLQDAKTTLVKPIIIPDNLKKKVTILSNCDLEENEITVFNAAITAMSRYISNNNIDLTNYSSFNIFFTYDGTLTLYEETNSNCGSQFHVAIYRMTKLRELTSIRLMLFVFIEEMAHYFLRISDETLIKHKVTEIMQLALPNFTIEEAKGWGLNGLQ